MKTGGIRARWYRAADAAEDGFRSGRLRLRRLRGRMRALSAGIIEPVEDRLWELRTARRHRLVQAGATAASTRRRRAAGLALALPAVALAAVLASTLGLTGTSDEPSAAAKRPPSPARGAPGSGDDSGARAARRSQPAPGRDARAPVDRAAADGGDTADGRPGKRATEAAPPVGSGGIRRGDTRRERSVQGVRRVGQPDSGAGELRRQATPAPAPAPAPVAEEPASPPPKPVKRPPERSDDREGKPPKGGGKHDRDDTDD
jgi:hypothetical protein